MKRLENCVAARLAAGLILFFLALPMSVQGAEKSPVRLAVIAEYGVRGSQAAQSIEKGVRLAVAEINAAGGVMGGRPLEVVTRDDRGLPARAVRHMLDLSEDPSLMAIFCGRFSPVALELEPVANRLGLLLLDPWAAADNIANNGAQQNYVFRLSLTDSWAMEAMLRYAMKRDLKHVAVMLPNTAWGRSNQAALVRFASRHPQLSFEVQGYNWGDSEFGDKLARARASGADALILVANEAEGAPMVRAMAALPVSQRLPIISHWGITGGNFALVAGEALHQVDLVVVQSFSFAAATGPRARAVGKRYQSVYGESVQKLLAVSGFAHAYDLTHLLAQAMNRPGVKDRSTVRDALEKVGPHQGLVRHYARPFSASDHEALDADQVSLARFNKDGTLYLID